MHIYIIAAYESAPRVRDLHARLRELGHTPTSRWAEQAHGPEELGDYVACEAIVAANLRDMRSADVVIILADTPMREGWCEVARVTEQRVIVVGRPNLTTRANGWMHVIDDNAAVRALDDRRCPKQDLNALLSEEHCEVASARAKALREAAEVARAHGGISAYYAIRRLAAKAEP